jgi:Tfp pilus assembly protein PilF
MAEMIVPAAWDAETMRKRSGPVPPHLRLSFFQAADYHANARAEVDMRRWPCCAMLFLFGAAGCLEPNLDRVREYTQDGVFLYAHQDYGHAKECFQAALAKKAGDPDLLYNLGQCCDRLGQDDLAERYYNDCLRRAPDQAECRHALGVLLVREGRWPDATNLVRDWVQRQPKSATAVAEDAWLWRVYGDVPKAQQRVEEALAMDPHDNRALLEEAQIYETLRRPDRAVFLYELALRYKPDQPDVKERVERLRTAGASRPRPD